MTTTEKAIYELLRIEPWGIMLRCPVAQGLDIARSIRVKGWSVHTGERSLGAKDDAVLDVVLRGGEWAISHDGRTMYLGNQGQWPTLCDLVELLIARRNPEYLFVHAACVAVGDRVVLLAGPSNNGKSTLSGALAQIGFEKLADDLTPIHFDSCGAGPFPAPPDELARNGDTTPTSTARGRGKLTHLFFLNAPGGELREVEGTGSWGEFLELIDGRPRNGLPPPARSIRVRFRGDFDLDPRLVAIPRSDAVRRLIRLSLGSHFQRADLIGRVSRLVRDCHCYELQPGHLDQTRRLIHDTVCA